jgi:hypothetical protein
MGASLKDQQLPPTRDERAEWGQSAFAPYCYRMLAAPLAVNVEAASSRVIQSGWKPLLRSRQGQTASLRDARGKKSRQHGDMTRFCLLWWKWDSIKDETWL